MLFKVKWNPVTDAHLLDHYDIDMAAWAMKRRQIIHYWFVPQFDVSHVVSLIVIFYYFLHQLT